MWFRHLFSSSQDSSFTSVIFKNAYSSPPHTPTGVLTQQQILTSDLSTSRSNSTNIQYLPLLDSTVFLFVTKDLIRILIQNVIRKHTDRHLLLPLYTFSNLIFSMPNVNTKFKKLVLTLLFQNLDDKYYP